jgi:hypothetical protein
MFIAHVGFVLELWSDNNLSLLNKRKKVQGQL